MDPWRSELFDVWIVANGYVCHKWSCVDSSTLCLMFLTFGKICIFNCVSPNIWYTTFLNLNHSIIRQHEGTNIHCAVSPWGMFGWKRWPGASRFTWWHHVNTALMVWFIAPTKHEAQVIYDYLDHGQPTQPIARFAWTGLIRPVRWHIHCNFYWHVFIFFAGKHAANDRQHWNLEKEIILA